MSSASKVGELFRAAGLVFTQLGDSTAQLQPLSDKQSQSSGRPKKYKKHMVTGQAASSLAAKKLKSAVQYKSSKRYISKKQQRLADAVKEGLQLEQQLHAQEGGKLEYGSDVESGLVV